MSDEKPTLAHSALWRRPRRDAGLSITNVSACRPPSGTAAGRLDVSFDVAWSGSWRDAEPSAGRCNWDAAWIFVKFLTWDSATVPVADPTAIVDALDACDPSPFLDAWRAHSADMAREWLDGKVDVALLSADRRWSLVHERPLVGSTVPEVIRKRLMLNWDEGEMCFVISRASEFGHAQINSVLSAPNGADIDLASDGMGVFIYRDKHNVGEDDVSFQGVSLRVVVANDKVDPDGAGLLVTGVEMVHVPAGPFSLGDPLGPAGPSNCFYDASRTVGDRSYRVDSEAEIAVGPGADARRLFYRNDQTPNNPGDQTGPIPGAFPKGYQAFYVMKRMITQGQYAEFVNTLQGAALTSRFSYWYGDYRYTMVKNDAGRRFALRPNRACNWLSYMDGAAYACWAGLRPMTEFEYEKACRGPRRAITGEYAWGNTNLARAQVIFSEDDGEEAVDGNCNVANAQFTFVGGDRDAGPLADDAFGAAGEFGHMFLGGLGLFLEDHHRIDPDIMDPRERTGQSFYGVRSLSGNLWEFCVTAGNAKGRAFTGKHGKGVLDDHGNPPTDELGWPGVDVAGIGGRGGSWYTPATCARVADRAMGAGLAYYTGRSHDMGFRGARTAPAHATTVTIDDD